MPFFTDQLGRTISLHTVPKRIVSLVPSQTELLAYLGLDEEVVGITKFCIHPAEWYRTKARVGGTKNINIEKIRSLQPHLIIANREENIQSQIEVLAKEFPVWVSDVNSLTDAYAMIRAVGCLVNKHEKGEALVQQLTALFSLSSTTKMFKAAYLIWKDPYMTVGGDTFIHSMMVQAGFDNVFAHTKRYPQISVSDLHSVGCECILLSSEPYPFKQKHIEELQAQVPNATIHLVDGEMFSWYGSRLRSSPSYFADLRKKITAAT